MPRLKISDAPLLGSIVGDEKIPTGKYGDYTLTPDMIVTFAQGKLPFVTQAELAQVKIQLEDSINTVQTTLSADIDVLSGKVDGMESQVLGVTQDLTIHKTDYNNPHQVNKSQVGLGNVDNTSDANKPISTATQAALNQKISSVNGKTGNSIILTRDDVGVPTDDQIKAFTKDAKFIIDESGLTQQEINNGVSSVSALEATKAKPNQVLFLKSYWEGKNLGGGEVVAFVSTIDVSNGVTIFKSSVVENLYFKRLDTSALTVEMAGALPEPTFDSREAFHRCTKIGGEYELSSESSYLLLHPQDVSTTKVLPYYNKPFKFFCKTKDASIVFSHSYTNASPYAFGSGDNSRCPSITLDGLKLYGSKTVGVSNKALRCWGVDIRGANKARVRNCLISTFNGHNLVLTRQTDIDWMGGNPNSKNSVMLLNSLNSKNVIVEDNHFEHVGTTPCAGFGVSNLHFRRNTVNITGALYQYLIFTDDASAQTPIKDYSTNNDIFIYDNIAPDCEIRIDATPSGLVENNIAKIITYRTYDFDQQKNNFDSGNHIYNPNDHLQEPFLWLSHFDQNVSIRNNTVNEIALRGYGANVNNNTLISSSDNSTLITYSRNGILWGTGVSYFDDTENGYIKESVASSNTFILKNNNCTCVSYNPTSPTQYFSAIDSIVSNYMNYDFRHTLYSTGTLKKDTYTKIGAITTNTYVNTPTVLSSRTIIQGEGKNYVELFNTYRGGQGAQSLISFTNTTHPVVLSLVISSSDGNVMHKKASVTSAGIVTITDLNGQTALNSAFTVTSVSGVNTLNINAASGIDVSVGIIGIGRYGDTVFKLPESRRESTG